MRTTGPGSARGTSHAYPFYGGEFLGKMGAAWFVSHAYHEHVDAAHTNWNRIRTVRTRIAHFGKTFSYHRYWLDKVMSMDGKLLETNKIGLTAIQIKDMAKIVMSKDW